MLRTVIKGDQTLLGALSKICELIHSKFKNSIYSIECFESQTFVIITLNEPIRQIYKISIFLLTYSTMRIALLNNHNNIVYDEALNFVEFKQFDSVEEVIKQVEQVFNYVRPSPCDILHFNDIQNLSKEPHLALTI